MSVAENQNFRYIHTINPYKKIESFNTLAKFDAGTPAKGPLNRHIYLHIYHKKERILITNLLCLE